MSSDKNPAEEYIEPNPSFEEIEEEIKVMEKVNEVMDEAENRATKKIKHSGFSEDSIVQQYVQYAYEIGGMDLVTTIECENGTWNMYRQSDYVRDGVREDSWGFCQIHRPDHKDIVNNPLFRSDYKWQLDRCAELLKGGTVFYGRNTRKIKGISCPKYVENRFILSD